MPLTMTSAYCLVGRINSVRVEILRNDSDASILLGRQTELCEGRGFENLQ